MKSELKLMKKIQKGYITAAMFDDSFLFILAILSNFLFEKCCVILGKNSCEIDKYNTEIKGTSKAPFL